MRNIKIIIFLFVFTALVLSFNITAQPDLYQELNNIITKNLSLELTQKIYDLSGDSSDFEKVKDLIEQQKYSEAMDLLGEIMAEKSISEIPQVSMADNTKSEIENIIIDYFKGELDKNLVKNSYDIFKTLSGRTQKLISKGNLIGIDSALEIFFTGPAGSLDVTRKIELAKILGVIDKNEQTAEKTALKESKKLRTQIKTSLIKNKKEAFSELRPLKKKVEILERQLQKEKVRQLSVFKPDQNALNRLGKMLQTTDELIRQVDVSISIEKEKQNLLNILNQAKVDITDLIKEEEKRISEKTAEVMPPAIVSTAPVPVAPAALPSAAMLPAETHKIPQPVTAPTASPVVQTEKSHPLYVFNYEFKNNALYIDMENYTGYKLYSFSVGNIAEGEYIHYTNSLRDVLIFLVFVRNNKLEYKVISPNGFIFEGVLDKKISSIAENKVSFIQSEERSVIVQWTNDAGKTWKAEIDRWKGLRGKKQIKKPADIETP